jgi:hypothetical protein
VAQSPAVLARLVALAAVAALPTVEENIRILVGLAAMEVQAWPVESR